jgi:hypothetical protein
MAFVNPATAVIVGAVDSHHLLGLYRTRSAPRVVSFRPVPHEIRPKGGFLQRIATQDPFRRRLRGHRAVSSDAKPLRYAFLALKSLRHLTRPSRAPNGLKTEQFSNI